MDRRHFIKYSGFGALSMVPYWDVHSAWGRATSSTRTVVMIELTGGNDGLNTVVPYTDSEYYRLRPTLAIKPDKVIPASARLGFHPALKSLMPCWDAGDTAVVLGVGYDQPDRSHFRSIDIWNTASDADEVLTDGWLAKFFSTHGGHPTQIDGLVLGKANLGALDGPAIRTAVVGSPRRFMKTAQHLPTVPKQVGHASLDHILGVQHNLLATSRLLAASGTASTLPVRFPKHRLGKTLALAAQMILAKLPVRVLKISQPGYDTHTRQAHGHARLLRQLAKSVAALRETLIHSGQWDDVLVMTYSEFGRRIKENASHGTDHGAAAPHFVFGGRVKGGWYGEQPSLVNTINGDLIYNVDYRRLYTTLAQHWWRLDPNVVANPTRFQPLDLIRD